MKNRNLIVAAGVALVLVILLLANIRIFQPGDAAKLVKTGEAKAVSLPAEFPKDFPVYPGAIYTGADDDQGQINGRMWNRGWFETRDAGPKVIEWYDAQLTQAGYSPLKTSKKGSDKQYSFATEKEIIQMEAFTETNKPTTFSVDFYAAPK